MKKGYCKVCEKTVSCRYLNCEDCKSKDIPCVYICVECGDEVELITYYRILVEVDENCNEIPSVAVFNTNTLQVENWLDSIHEAIDWARENGELATEN